MTDNIFKFGRLFVPGNVPVAILPFLTLVEIVSYASRLLSLAIRLFANMMAGHTLLKILIAFTFSLFNTATLEFN
jgi:F-type H+-transporting ATPase subunit a